MWYVYILQSQKDDSYYVWYTQDIQKRFDQHNAWESNYTSKKIPRTLLYYEAFNNKYLALQREKKLKTWSKSRQELFKRIIKI